ncbi:MAG: hypothetical protein DMG55_00225 [Acidobacteria bacterium]|nr:MAG: hypothetical protein DMG55_00225 [Acidobacteriota bacterium]
MGEGVPTVAARETVGLGRPGRNGFFLRNFKLRTKFLLSLLAITTGLTTATLLIVRYSVQSRVRESIRDDLRNSVNTYKSFEQQRDLALTRSASLIANLPNVRALMTTRDEATIQDASYDIQRLSGSEDSRSPWLRSCCRSPSPREKLEVSGTGAIIFTRF